MKFVSEIKVVGNTMIAQLPSSKELEDGKYIIEVMDYKKTRSSSQNALLWAIINEISKRENGDYSGSQQIYLNLLKMAGAKTVIVSIPKDAVEGFKTLYRDIEVLGYEGDKATVRAYYGSSTMNTKEMSDLIDMAIRYAEEIGIDTDAYLEIIHV